MNATLSARRHIRNIHNLADVIPATKAEAHAWAEGEVERDAERRRYLQESGYPPAPFDPPAFEVRPNGALFRGDAFAVLDVGWPEDADQPVSPTDLPRDDGDYEALGHLETYGSLAQAVDVVSRRNAARLAKWPAEAVHGYFPWSIAVETGQIAGDHYSYDHGMVAASAALLLPSPRYACRIVTPTGPEEITLRAPEAAR
jgi:hypothetical protein